MQETRVWSLCQENPLEKEMASYSSILAWEIPRTGELGGLQRVRHNWVTEHTRPTLCDPMDYSLPGSSAHGISQASIREWVVISFSKGSFQPSDRDSVSYIDRQILYHWATWGAPSLLILFTFISVGQRWLNYYTERSMPLKEEFMTYISWDKGACHACRTRGEALTSSDEEQKQKWG